LERDRVFVGVLRAVVLVPGARSLKDRRQAVQGLRSRIVARLSVSVHEVDTSDQHNRQVLVVTTAGNAAPPVRQVLDQAAGILRECGAVHVADLDIDVFRWHAQVLSADHRFGSLLPMPSEDSDG
jgi:uncharacterized protein YlxP (DUF503 family)